MSFICFTFVDYIHLLFNSRLKSFLEVTLYCYDTCRLKINFILSPLTIRFDSRGYVHIVRVIQYDSEIKLYHDFWFTLKYTYMYVVTSNNAKQCLWISLKSIYVVTPNNAKIVLESILWQIRITA